MQNLKVLSFIAPVHELFDQQFGFSSCYLSQEILKVTIKGGVCSISVNSDDIYWCNDHGMLF